LRQANSTWRACQAGAGISVASDKKLEDVTKSVDPPATTIPSSVGVENVREAHNVSLSLCRTQGWGDAPGTARICMLSETAIRRSSIRSASRPFSGLRRIQQSLSAVSRAQRRSGSEMKRPRERESPEGCAKHECRDPNGCAGSHTPSFRLAVLGILFGRVFCRADEPSCWPSSRNTLVKWSGLGA